MQLREEFVRSDKYLALFERNVNNRLKYRVVNRIGEKTRRPSGKSGSGTDTSVIWFSSSSAPKLQQVVPS